ncbi:MAG TPA: acylneuraminate cytidylyltransferase family protein [Anaerolineae bacterium]|nr:acylneuraminate cytidylyltransferase family protein [Anaerolineae bacterium]HID83865.1 acylneuraminate cytidylyltransferase family protein [Anaerolineales bacterium]HIQ08918.1 acylneuraminate cytidylyltransferase family protein [Anaerolineaceae bacterium]
MTPPRVVALVPMRHHSERVPGKNYRPLAGKPLFHWILETLLAVPTIAEVVVDTDSPLITQGVREYFPRVRVLERPEHLRDGHIPMNEVLLHDVRQVPGDFYLQTHSTNPLLRAETVERAIRTFLAHYPAYDSLFSVTRIQTRLWDQLARPINHNPAILLRTQDLPPVYEENSCLYIFSRDLLERRRNRIGERPYLFEIPAEEALDIDEEIDFLMADFLARRRLTQPDPEE